MCASVTRWYEVFRFSIPVEKLVNFVVKCRDSYRDGNPFHNWKHAWSVTHCAFMIIITAPVEKILTANEVCVRVCVYVCACVRACVFTLCDFG